MRQRLPKILLCAGIAFTEINVADDIKSIDRELPEIIRWNSIHAFLLNPAVWEGSECGTPDTGYGMQDKPAASHHASGIVHPSPSPTLTRYDIIKIIAPYLEGKVVVSNLGWPSKELYAIRHQSSNFYMLGSMGMAAPVGLGIALTSKKEVVVIDGDGSLLMNPGTLATTASLVPKNLTIFAIDNGAYGSTGNQPTLTGTCVDLEQVAQGFGFRNTAKAASEADIVDAMKQPRSGLTFIHALAVPGNKDVPNIPLHHLEIKRSVEEFLRK